MKWKKKKRKTLKGIKNEEARSWAVADRGPTAPLSIAEVFRCAPQAVCPRARSLAPVGGAAGSRRNSSNARQISTAVAIGVDESGQAQARREVGRTSGRRVARARVRGSE